MFIIRTIKLIPIRARVFYSYPRLGRYFVPLNGFTSFKNFCVPIHTIPTTQKANSGDYYIKVLDAELLQRKEPVSLDLETEKAAFQKGVRRYQDGYRYQAPEVFLAYVRKAKVLSNSFLILSPDDRIFRDSVFRNFHLGWINELYGFRLPPINRRLKTCVVLGSLWCRGYYHWLNDVLPRLYILEKFEHLQSIPLLLPSGLTQNQYESLHLLGISRDRIIEFDGGHWQVDRLYFPSFLSRTGNSRPQAVSWLRNHFWKELGIQVGRGDTRRSRLYISRRDAECRRIVNEEELVDFLESRGFKGIVPGELSFAEQVRIFSQAEIIIGPHGSGLANMVFTPPGATLIELFPPNYINCCYWALANACNNRYAFTIGTIKNRVSQDFEISLDKVKKLLEVLPLD